MGDGKTATKAKAIFRAAIGGAAWIAMAIVAFLLFPVVSKYFSSPQFLAIIVAMNVVATIALWWRTAAPKPPRPKKAFLDQLMYSKPITPKHDPPRVAGAAFASLATAEDRIFFSDFDEFGHVVNWRLADEHVGSSWRIQELPESDVRLNVDFSSGPTLGRCYDIFHNQVRMGRLEITAGHEYSTATPHVLTEIELHNARLLGFNSIAGFLRDVAMHVCEQKPEAEHYVDATPAITRAMTEALWRDQQITEYLDRQDWGEFSFHLESYVSEWYFRRRDALLQRALEAKARK